MLQDLSNVATCKVVVHRRHGAKYMSTCTHRQQKKGGQGGHGPS